MTSDLLSSIAYLFSAAPTTPSHDQLDITIYENGFTSSTFSTTPVLSDSSLSKAYVYPRLFVAIRSVLVHAAIRWPSMLPSHQIADSLSESLFIIGEYQVVFCRSELTLLVSGESAQDIISHCLHHNTSIPWATLMALDAQTRPMVHFKNVPVDPLEQFLNFEEFQMRNATIYAQSNEYDGPLFDDWNPPTYPPGYDSVYDSVPETVDPHHVSSMSMYSLPSGVYPVEYAALDTLPHDISVNVGEPSFQPVAECLPTVTLDSYEESTSPSPSSTRSSPFPETPGLDNFCSELPRIVSPMSTINRDGASQEEERVSKATEPVHATYPTTPSVVALSPLSEYESLPSSRCSSASPSSQSSDSDFASSTPDEETFQIPVKVAGKKIRRVKAGAIKKKKTKSKEKHFCCYCNEPFTRDHDAERHQRTCKSNPNCSQKEQCKVCSKPLPVRLDARRRHWGTLECSDAARKRGFTRMDEESYEFL